MSKFRGSHSNRPEVTYYLMRGGTLTFDASRPLGESTAEWQRHVQMVDLAISRTFSDHGSASMTFACANRQWATAFLDALRLGDYFVIRLPHPDESLTTAGAALEFGFVDSISIGESTSPLKSECIVDVGCQMWGGLLSRAEIWFDILSEGIIGATAFSKALFDNQATNEAPAQTIFALLRGLTQTLSTKPNSSEWQLPPELGLSSAIQGASGKALVDTILFDGVRGLHPYPARRSGLAPTLYTPEAGTLWDLLMQWSEPSFLELYTDIELWSVTPSWDSKGRVPHGAALSTLGSSFNPVVRLRNRPFPSTTLKSPGGRPLSWGDPEQPWNQLPTLELRREDVSRLVLGQHGEERRNSFFITCSLPGGVAGTYHAFMSPKVLKAQARLYGARRMDLHTPYVPYRAAGSGSPGQPFDPGGLSVLKTRGAHYYGANHLFYSGEVEMTSVQPELRLGTRLRIEGGDTNAGTLLGYVEGYGHSWSLGSGMRSTAMLTRALYEQPGASYIDQISEAVEERDAYALLADPTPSIA